MGGHVLNPHTPMFKISGRTSSSYTPPINNSTAFQFGNTVFATNGFSVSNTFSRVTVPVTGKYYLKVHIQHVGTQVLTLKQDIWELILEKILDTSHNP